MDFILSLRFLLPALSIAASLPLKAASWGLSMEHTFAFSQRFWFGLMVMVMEVVALSKKVQILPWTDDIYSSLQLQPPERSA